MGESGGAMTVNELLARARRARGTAEVRALARAAARERADSDSRAWLRLVCALAARGERFLAYEMVDARRECVSVLTTASVEQLGDGIDSWGSVDCFACYVAGPAWREGGLSDARIARWARSSDRWWRRAALVASVPLNVAARGGAGDSRRTLGVCALLVDDRDDMVVKALSWALRALVGRDRAAVERFLARHGKRLAPRVRREVGSKLRTGRKNPAVRRARRA